MTDFQRVLRIISIIFIASTILAAFLAAFHAVYPSPLIDFLVRRLSDIMLICVSSIGGLVAGQKLERRR